MTIEADALVIQTEKLTKTFGEVHALNGVDLHVPKHSIFGFLGPNGAGKTTFMKMLVGLIRPTSGQGRIFEHDIIRENVSIRERIGYLPQHPRFIDHMTAHQNLMFSARFFFSGPKRLLEDRCNEMLDLVGLAEKTHCPIKGFSGGEKQRLGIALAQVNYPELLILDEPASALDPIGRQAVLDIMERLRKYTTIFFSTHILDDVQRVSDTVAILNKGKVVASGPIDTILNGRDGVVYSMTFKGAENGLSEKVSALPWVNHVTHRAHSGGASWQISVSDEALAENLLLRLIMQDPNITVTEFNRKRYELEEVFMDIVQGDNDGN